METLLNWLSNVSYFILTLLGISLVIIFHEFGHFVLAKLNKIKVEAFSIGFGPALLKWKWGETEFIIASIPFGGYIKPYGEELSEETLKDPESFWNKPTLSKISTIFAGPFFNYLLAFLIFFILFTIGIVKIDSPPQIDFSTHNLKELEKNPLYVAGLRPADTIEEINNEKINTFKDIVKAIYMNVGKEVTIKVKRNNETINITVKIPTDISYENGEILDLIPYIPPKIDKVMKDSPADKAGLKEGDIVKAVNDEKIFSFSELSKMIQQSEGKPLKLLVDRGGKEITLTVEPEKQKEKYVIGIIVNPPFVVQEEKAKNVFEALWKGFVETNIKVKETIEGFILLFSGRLNVRQAVAGPVKIFYYSMEIARKAGIVQFFTIIAIISLTLAIVNLLPFPPLDGGKIFLFSIEGISGKKLNPAIVGLVETVGFVALIFLSVLVLFNDIFTLIQRK